jgi:hypothetical protein
MERGDKPLFFFAPRLAHQITKVWQTFVISRSRVTFVTCQNPNFKLHFITCFAFVDLIVSQIAAFG